MRWIWIDKFIDFQSETSATAIKNVSLAEEHLHDLYPNFPVHPNSLIVEGMAQTAGILVGEARQFQEKVVLAKIGKAVFTRLVRPGETITYTSNWPYEPLVNNTPTAAIFLWTIVSIAILLAGIGDAPIRHRRCGGERPNR